MAASLKHARFHFDLWSLFRVQLLLSPIFLIPLYLSRNQEHSYATGLAILLAPAVYVTALLCCFGTSAKRASPVYSLIRCGAGWGVVFGLFSMVPAFVVEWIPRFPQWKMQVLLLSSAFFYASIREQVLAHPVSFLFHAATVFLVGPAMVLFVLLHYALIGAAVGGLIGLMKRRDLRRFKIDLHSCATASARC